MLDSHSHVHVPAEPGVRTTLVLLHGTGGDERQLLDLGRRIAPGAGLLGIRGNVLEGGRTTRWFRRLREGVFDTEDLVSRSDQLGTFVDAAIGEYHLHPDGLLAMGFSNGANTGAALLLRRPALLRGGVFVSSMLPFTPEHVPDLSHAAVLMVQGRVDPYAPAEQAEALAALLTNAGAAVDLRWHDQGHALGPLQATIVHEWLARWQSGTAASLGATPA